jgi:hypothetical protein
LTSHDGYGADACRHEPALRPDEADVSDVVQKFVEYRDHARMIELIGERDLGKKRSAQGL